MQFLVRIIISIPYIYIVNSITVYKDALIHKNLHFSFEIDGSMRDRWMEEFADHF